MGGGIGDVAYAAVGSGWVQAFASAGALAPLDDLVKNDKLDPNQYLPNMVTALRLGDNGIGAGPLYGLPLLVHARDTVLFFNKGLLAPAGANVPDGATISCDDSLNLAKNLPFKPAHD